MMRSPARAAVFVLLVCTDMAFAFVSVTYQHHSGEVVMKQSPYHHDHHRPASKGRDRGSAARVDQIRDLKDILRGDCTGNSGVACNGAPADAPVAVAPLIDHVKRVHIVYMNHLDVGYADLANNILNRYFVKFFALAAQVGEDLTNKGYVETFLYTTHPWLVSLYMDCPPNLVLAGIKLQCPNATEKDAFVKAVNNGFIDWHAGPMNVQMEMASEWLLNFGFRLSMDIDKRFNITRRARVLSQRDIPGLTIGSLPVMRANGILGFSVGVNSVTPPPDVPAFFIWQVPEDKSMNIMAHFHRGGYPNNPGSNPAHPEGLSRADCLVVEEMEDALCFAFRTDNSGPPVNYTEVLGYYEILRAEFPTAELRASRLEDFFLSVPDRIKDKLPRITGEIGDVWISGLASDPRKCAEYRTVARILGDCIKQGACKLSDDRVYNASRLLLKVSEHTWGIDGAGDNKNWTNKEFQAIRDKEASFIRSRDSWVEQREFVYLTVDALGNHDVVAKILSALQELTPTLPDLTGYSPVTDIQQIFSCPAYSTDLQFGMDGSINKITYKKVLLVSPDYPLGVLQYRTYNETDIAAFIHEFAYAGGEPGYSKPNMTQYAHPQSADWPIHLKSLYVDKASSCRFYLSVVVSDTTAHTMYGAPEIFWIYYDITATGINIDVDWFNKTSTRLPEALFFKFNFVPQTKSDDRWLLHKVSLMVQPSSVVLNGSQRHHAVGDIGAWFMGVRDRYVQIISVDLPIITPIVGKDLVSAYPIPLQPISQPITGMAVNLYNNVWNTNWIFWYPYLDEDVNFKARFHVIFG